jgi:hypothetical protein
LRSLSKAKWVLGASALVGSATAVALLSGLPSRVGLTKSEANLSLPGDLIVPQAELQADRGITLKGSVSRYWSELMRIEELYEALWERELDLKYEVSGEILVWETAKDESQPWHGTLAVVAIPGVDGTFRLRVRERYSVSTYHTRGVRRASMVMAPFMLSRVKRA